MTSSFRSIVVPVCAGLALVAGTVSCAPAPSRTPDVVLIVIDTLRQDRLPFYGYSRPTAPNLSRVARTSRVFTEAYSVSTWTAPAHASLFTGLFPIAHGTTQLDWRLNPQWTTLAEALAEAGYRTVGISENPVVSTETGFDKGFQEFHETWQIKQGDEHEGTVATARARDTIVGAERDQPLFLFINFNGVHNPYNSAGPFRDAFVTDPTQRIEAHWLGHYYLGKRRYSIPELRHLGDLYDGEILMVDHQIGEVLDALDRNRSGKDAILVVLSDHGENIGDHGHVDHVFSMYETTVKIPLLIRYPRKMPAGSRDDRPAQITDIFPTLLGLIGESEDATGFQGADLLDPEARRDRSVFGEYYRPKQVFELFDDADLPLLRAFDRHLSVVIHDRLKLIRASEGASELYDLSRDPGETTDLIQAEDYAGRLTGLEARLENLIEDHGSIRASAPAPPEEELDEATLEKLRSLGYIK